LWTSDGTPEGTVLVKDIRPGGGDSGSSPTRLIDADGTLYFTADDGVTGRELWQSDGTAEGTVLVSDLFPGPTTSDPLPLGTFDGALYFAGTDFDHGRELFRTAIPAPPMPAVTAVYLSGSAWAAPFRQFLKDHGQGSADYGFSVLGGSRQLDTLPWTNLDRVSITFNSPVRVEASDLRVRGVAVADYALDPAAFRYDPGTRTATWKLANGATFGADRILLDLDGDTIDGVRGAADEMLDGDWSDAARSFPSGDGTPGGDFRFRVNVLPGDVDRSGSVLANDFSEVKQRFFRSTTNLGTGDSAYSVFNDVTGSGGILADDFSEVKKRFFNRLPDGSLATAALRWT
jgi:ELWxxDGT repeat protein